MRDVLPDHRAEMLGLGVGQVNESVEVDCALMSQSLKNPPFHSFTLIDLDPDWTEPFPPARLPGTSNSAAKIGELSDHDH